MEIENQEEKSINDTKLLEKNSSETSQLNKILAVVVLVGILSGMLGGIGGFVYAAKAPWVQKYLSGNQNVNVKDSKIVLEEDSAIIDVVKKTSPAVVSIVVSKDINKMSRFNSDPFSQDPFFQLFGLGAPQSQPKDTKPNIQQIAAGTGFFVSSDGIILTNRHVVSDDSASYSIVTNDGKTYDAKILTIDPVNDLAILKADVNDAPVLKFADSSSVQVGQRVVAIGNSLGQYQNTVTTGIVSGIGRSITAGGGGSSEELQGVLQTDAAINPGNSGGPLLNILGEVIGINTAIDNQGQSVGFAIPASDAQRALDSFTKNGKIVRPYLGVRYVLISKQMAEEQKLPKEHGALVVKGQTTSDLAVIPGSPADKAGLVENDIILQVNGKDVDEKHGLAFLLSNFQVGETVTLKVYSKGVEKEVKVKLEERK